MEDAGEQFHEGIPESDHLTVVVSEGWISGVERSDGRAGEDEGLLNVFIKHSYHQISPCCTCSKTCFHQQNTPRVLPGTPTTSTRWFKQEEFNQSIFIPSFTASSLTHCWQNIMDVYQKKSERPFGYTVLNLHPTSDDRKSVFSHLSDLSTRRIPTLASKKKRGCLIIDQNGILKISLIDSAHLKNAVLGEGRLKKNDHGWSFNR